VRSGRERDDFTACCDEIDGGLPSFPEPACSAARVATERVEARSSVAAVDD
jgi:hypothetical protein